MNAKPLFLAGLLTVGAALTAAAQGAATAPSEKRYHMDGKIVSVKPAAHTAVIDAKAVPGFMSAMAMAYTFKDSVELSKLKPGDHITADMVVSGGKSWVEKVVMVKDSAAKK